MARPIGITNKYLSDNINLNTRKNLFYSNVLIPNDNGCMEWIGSTHKYNSEYGVIRLNVKKRILAHRFSYELFIGKIPKNMCVLHECDNRRCVSPNHLRIGTKTENNEDRDKRNRAALGEKNGSCKLNPSKVKNIRLELRSGSSITTLGKKYDVNSKTIWKIKYGITWKHLLENEQ